ncbi:MAG: hypothetical protein H7Y13_15800 [Sphingobacteriaceae bacterium]|nr:hypothetical protein [Sphingobacteriaceae bacterium]
MTKYSCCSFLLFFFVFLKSFGQDTSKVNTASLPGAQYEQQLLASGQSRLYNGFEYLDYPYNYFKEGHQFFGNNTWNLGTVTYEGITYNNVNLMYDLIKDEVVVQHFDKVSKINLIKSKVQDFSLLGHTFVKLKEEEFRDAYPGFYDLLYNDKIAVLAKKNKKIAESTSSSGVVRGLYVFNKYYVQKGGQIYSFNSKSSLLKILKDKNQEIKNYIKNKNLKYKKDPETVMIAIAVYYDEITK